MNIDIIPSLNLVFAVTLVGTAIWSTWKRYLLSGKVDWVSVILIVDFLLVAIWVLSVALGGQIFSANVIRVLFWPYYATLTVVFILAVREEEETRHIRDTIVDGDASDG